MSMIKTIVKQVYDVFPFKKEIFTLSKHFVSPSENIYKHLHFKGVFKVPVDNSHLFYLKHYGFQIENEIFWEGLQSKYERVAVGFWIKLAREAKVVFDVGANTGVYSLIAKSLNPESKVYAFEPINRVYTKLRENNELNGYDIVCVEKAASNKDGTATVYDPQTEHVIAVTVGRNMQPPEVKVTPITIETTRLDTFIKEQKINRLDLIKLDVETHEPEVLEGMGEYLDLYKPTILIEVLDDETGEKIEKVVRNRGYLYFNINDRTGTVRQTTNITKSDHFNYLLCTQDVARSLNLLP